jgi:hypothetical protein
MKTQIILACSSKCQAIEPQSLVDSMQVHMNVSTFLENEAQCIQQIVVFVRMIRNHVFSAFCQTMQELKENSNSQVQILKIIHDIL